MKKIYIAGKITDEPKYKEIFAKAEVELKKEGYIVLNPSTLPIGMNYEDYMEICFAMIKQADEVYFLGNWAKSKGAIREMYFSMAYQKKMVGLEGEGAISWK